MTGMPSRIGHGIFGKSVLRPESHLRSGAQRTAIVLICGQISLVMSRSGLKKDALVDVVAKACSQYRVPYFSCRGFMSDSEVYKAGLRMRNFYDNGKEIVFLHLGDHDPSGIDMSRDILRRVELFGNLENKIDFHRIALNMDQIEELQPPPNPAKETDTRAKAYIQKYGRVSWELDALEPKVLTRLIRDEIERYLDADRFNRMLQLEDEQTEELLALASGME